MSRTTNTLRNAGTAMLAQVAVILLNFACRTVFIHTLGKEYLGISGLYANVLTVLSISELGFSTVITYRLYDPLARNDQELVRSLMAFFRSAYRVVGLAVLVLGLALMPFLPQLMTGVTDKVNIYHYYLLYLAQSVTGYWFFAYKSVLLQADQKKYLVDLVSIGCRAAVSLTQMAVLLVWRSFFGYTLLAVLSGVAQNVVTAVLVDRRYPYLKEPAQPLEKVQKKDLFSGIYATFLQRVSVAVGTATDNLIISANISVAAVGLYSNYQMVVGAVQTFLGAIFNAVTASVGSLLAEGKDRESLAVFRSLTVLNSWLVALCSVCFLSLFPTFIRLWAGEDYLLDGFTTVMIVLNFATNYLQSVILIYRSAAGLFVYGKYRSVVNAALNLGISLILVRPLGMAGVFLGSVVSRLATVWWYDGWLVCRRVFHTGPWWYYGSCAGTLILAWACHWTVEWLCGGLGAGWGTLLLRLAICCAVTTGVYALLLGRSPETRLLLDRLAAALKRHKRTQS